MGVGMGALMRRAGIIGGGGPSTGWAGGRGGGERMVGGSRGGAWAVVWFRLGLCQGLHLANGLGRRGSCNVRRVLRENKLTIGLWRLESVKL